MERSHLILAALCLVFSADVRGESPEARSNRFGLNLPSEPTRNVRPRPESFRLFRQSPPPEPFIQALMFLVPAVDGASSIWTNGWGMNDDGSPNPVSSWGYNTLSTARMDPSFRMMELTFEASYLNPQGFHQAEAYLQFQDLDGTYRRMLQFEIPFEGPGALETIGFTSTDWFSFMDTTSRRQRVKISDLFALARNVPFVFSDSADCAGCGIEVGLRPLGAGELAVVRDMSNLLGDFRASTVRATAFVGDGSGITAIDASAIRTGTLPESVLPASVRSTRSAAAVRREVVGQAVLRGGRAVVETSAVRPGSRVFLSYAGAVGQLGSLFVAQIVDGRSFEIRSTSSSDESPVNYWILDDH